MDPGTTERWRSGDRTRSGPSEPEADRSRADPADEQRRGAPRVPTSVGRRELLGAIGTAAAAGLAGCSGGGGSSGPPISQPTSHAQDMTLSIVQDGSAQFEQNVHLEFDDPDFLMDVQMDSFGNAPVPFTGYRFLRVDGTVYIQMMGTFCQEANRGSDDVLAMGATPARFESYGGLERTETTTLDGVEVEVYESDTDDVPLGQLGTQPEISGGGDFGGQMPGGGDSFEQPAYLDPDSVQEGTMKLWIGTENEYLRQAEQTAVFGADDVDYRFDMAAENYDFGEDFGIQAPPNCGDGGGWGG